MIFFSCASGKGLSAFESALAKAAGPYHIHAEKDLGVARAAGLHFDSVANQVGFTLARNALLSGSLDKRQREAQIAAIRTAVQNEIADAKALFVLAREDPRIGFEASNQYYYLPLDLVEKVVNCEYILKKWLPQQEAILSEDDAG